MLKSIFLERAEGPRDECGVFEYASFKEAHVKIRAWARTAPDSGGYDKTDVRITFTGIEPGEDTSFSLRFDMTRDHSVQPIPLLSEALSCATFYAGLRCPGHMTREQYTSYLDRAVKPERRALYGKIGDALAAEVNLYMATPFKAVRS